MIGNPSLVNIEIPDFILDLELRAVFSTKIVDTLSNNTVKESGYILKLKDYVTIRNSNGYHIHGMKSNQVEFCDSITNNLIASYEDDSISWTNLSDKYGFRCLNFLAHPDYLNELSQFLESVVPRKLNMLDSYIFTNNIMKDRYEAKPLKEISSTFNLPLSKVTYREKALSKALNLLLTGSVINFSYNVVIPLNELLFLRSVIFMDGVKHRTNSNSLIFFCEKFKCSKNHINNYIHILRLLFYGELNAPSFTKNKKPIF